MKQRMLLLGLLVIVAGACRNAAPEKANNLQEAGATPDVAIATAGSNMATAGSNAGAAVAGVAKDIEDRLSAQVWQWEGSMGPGDSNTMVPDPSAYTVTFVPGGSVAIKADCKTAGGTYAADESSLVFDLKVISTDACAAGSMADTFIAQLQKADTYLVEDGQLTIGLVNDEGTMNFKD